MRNSHFTKSACESLLAGAERIYFGGLLGASQSAMALLLKESGRKVAGCDRREMGAEAERICREGILLEKEDTPQLREGDLVVYSLALDAQAPLFARAQQMGVPCMSRAQLLGALMAHYRTRVVVSGTHGKSTTVGMLSAILCEAGVEPTVVGGAPLSMGGDHYRRGKKEIFLTEGCEYMDSFLCLSPTLGILTNLEFDHPDYFESFAALKSSFSQFIARCKDICVNYGCESLVELCPKGTYTFGFSPKATLFAQVREGGLILWERGERLGEITLHLKGAYQRENALAAVAGARCLGIGFSHIQKALNDFTGIGRRLESIGTYRGAQLYLDYAHHPTQIAAALDALVGEGRVWCIYQPHTYTRTKALWEDFCRVLMRAEHAILVDIYPAREAPIAGITSEQLARAAGIKYAPTLSLAKAYLDRQIKAGDRIVLMGAGDIADGASLFLGD